MYGLQSPRLTRLMFGVFHTTFHDKTFFSCTGKQSWCGKKIFFYSSNVVMFVCCVLWDGRLWRVTFMLLVVTVCTKFRPMTSIGISLYTYTEWLHSKRGQWIVCKAATKAMDHKWGYCQRLSNRHWFLHMKSDKSRYVNWKIRAIISSSLHNSPTSSLLEAF